MAPSHCLIRSKTLLFVRIEEVMRCRTETPQLRTGVESVVLRAFKSEALVPEHVITSTVPA
jgi:hypothetical protein